MSVCMFVPCEEDLSFPWRGLLHIPTNMGVGCVCVCGGGFVGCHVSCVMSHVSCVMCHVSRVMCHVSHVGCHMSYFFYFFCVWGGGWCHVSCVMSHVSCVTCHVSCVTCHVSRVTCHMIKEPLLVLDPVTASIFAGIFEIWSLCSFLIL